MIDVQLRGITKAYEPTRPVLADIDLDIAAGELFFLLGPSGCGKSTLLRLLAGFLPPDRGTIRFGTEDVTRLPAEKRETAMVFQNYALWPHLTVAQNVAFGLEVRRIPTARRDQQVREALELVGLADLARRPAPALSGGQQQRVALARALVVRPRVLLLDEPLSNLDAKLRLTMREEIRRLCKDAKLTTVYVTHDQKEALSMADRVAILHEGRLQQVAAPREVYRQPGNRFVADFVGAGNFLAGTVKDRQGALVEVESALGLLSSTAFAGQVHPGSRVTLVIRPESLRLEAGLGSPNTFAARVVSGMFLGEFGQWTLAVGDTRLTVYELQPRPRTAGDEVRLFVAPEDVILLAEG